MPEASRRLHGRTLAELKDHLPALSALCSLTPLRYWEGPERDVFAVQVVTGSGFEYTVLPDRGLNIAHARFRGIPLDWSSGTGVRPPAAYESAGWKWLRSFHGGLVHMCGLDNVGKPCVDPEAPGDNKEFGGHGRLGSTPAREVSWRTVERGGWVELEVSGKLHQTSALEESLLLERIVRSECGGNRLTLRDRITNLGHLPIPVFLLYHCNLGFPLLSGASRLFLPCDSARNWQGEPVPDPEALLPPQEEALETVLYPEVSEEQVTVSLFNPELEGGMGLYLSYRRSELPCLTVWKCFRKRTYVLGIEPGTCRVEGRTVEKRRVRELARDESCEVNLEIGLRFGKGK
jgi:hypothetical protein